MKTGLVLEGGGMRGMYTIGVLDRFLNADISFDYVIGVSAGACNGVSFVAQQKGRNYRINTRHILDKRYMSLRNLVQERSLFGMNFLFNTVPNELDPFDYTAFLASPTEFVVGVTDVELGRADYFTKEALDHDATALCASSSIPCFSPMVSFRGKQYLDGGTADPIPFKKALTDGCDRLVVVLTRNRAYRKQPEKLRALCKVMYRHHPALIALMERRYLIYNRALADLRALETEGTAMIIAPENPLEIGRFEKNPQRLSTAAQLGYHDAAAVQNKVKAFLSGAPY
ncbi:MAG: patatin family protein [Candidatus Fimivivens sp.]